MSEILRTEENGVEYFTVVETGESGMSQRGLARACGVDENTIRYLVKSITSNNLRNKSTQKRFKRFVGEDLSLRNKIPNKNGGAIKALNAKFCFAVIKHYAVEGYDTAEITLDSVGEIGITAFIHQKTGHTPKQYIAAPQAHLTISQIMDKPRVFEPLFGNTQCNKIAKFLNTHRTSPKMAQWWIRFVYYNLSKEDWEKLN